jgi:predicted nucleic acid-binding protein
MALWKKWRRKQYLTSDLQKAPLALAALVTRVVPLSLLFARAAEMSHALSHPIYDCFYLTLAERERVPLITADKRLAAAAARLEGVVVCMLE